MKVILSRKGFDSTKQKDGTKPNGGIASPILPDKTLLSLPIPENGGKAYSELHYNGISYSEIIKQLGGGNIGETCHLDPDIRQGVFAAPADWKAAFGQRDGELTHLKKQGVGVDDLFLFFGWFRQTEQVNGNLRYVCGDSDGKHVIYGYLQVGDIVTDKNEISKYHWHPHACMTTIKNCLFVARDTLSWDSNRSGYGVFQYDERLVLTKDGMSKSKWRLPELPIFNGSDTVKISKSRADAWDNTDPKHGKYYRALDRGQEFVIEETPAVENWAKSLIDG